MCPKIFPHLCIIYAQQNNADYFTGYDGDVICLQEVDRKMFNRELLPVLMDHGFDGNYKEKYGSMAEGEAIFYRRSKFRCVNWSVSLFVGTCTWDLAGWGEGQATCTSSKIPKASIIF